MGTFIHHVAIVPPPRRWPRLCVCLQWSAGICPVFLRIWSSHLPRGRPGLRLQEESGGRQKDELTWTATALRAGTLACSLVMCPKMEMRLRLVMSRTEDKPVWARTSSFRMNCVQTYRRDQNHYRAPHISHRSSSQGDPNLMDRLLHCVIITVRLKK